MNLVKLQNDLKIWLDYNFPNTTADMQLKGVMEELGELCHADLKNEQGIRGYTNEKAELEIKDAIGDLVIFLINYCNKKGLSFKECITIAHHNIQKRDWVQNPKKGLSFKEYVTTAYHSILKHDWVQKLKIGKSKKKNETNKQR